VLEQFQIQDLRRTKEAFYKSGFVTYKDVEHLALTILSDTRFEDRIGLLVARYPCIIVDECQDLSAEQMAVLDLLVKRGVKLHLVGDLNQSIYGFRNCRPEAISKFIHSIVDEEISLDENFRSGQAIVDMYGKFVQSPPVVGRPNFALQTCYLLEYDKSPTEVLARFDALAIGHSQTVIVARGHSTLDKFRYSAADPSPVEILALAISLFAREGSRALRDSLALFSYYLSGNCIDSHTSGADTYYRPLQASSELAWHLFLFQVMATLAASGLANHALTWQAWCTTLKTALPKLSAVEISDPAIRSVQAALQQKRHRSPPKLSGTTLAASLDVLPQIRQTTRLATIHEVKGETHDLTMLVSSTRKGQESHWKEWLEDAKGEAARFAYVASSRPRYILIWAVKLLKKEEKKQLLALGFQE
jgi:DNA helicase-2/ATP-dependent DNA helicase PcrA